MITEGEFMNIKSKVLISYLFLIIFSILLLGGIFAYKSHKALSSEIQNKNNQVSNLIVDMVNTRDELLEDKTLSDMNFAVCHLNDEIKILQNASNRTLDRLLSQLEQSTGGIFHVYKLEGSSLKLFTNNSTHRLDNIIDPSSDIYTAIMEKKTFLGVTQTGYVSYTSGYTPLLSKDNTVIGALVVSHKQLNKEFKERISKIKIGTNGYVYIINSNGDVILHPKNEGKSILPYHFSKDILSTKNGHTIYTYKDVKKMATFKYYEPWDWYIVSTSNSDDINKPAISLLTAVIFISVLILLLGVLLSSILADTIVKPIIDLKYCMEQFSKGDRDIQHDTQNLDEIGVLSKTFNTLVHQNNKLLQEIRNQSKVKTEFFSNISHELKTPLNIIFSANQLIDRHIELDNSIEPEILKDLNQNIKQNCYRLLKLVNNIIDMPRLDSGNLKLNKINVNIVEVIENISMSTVQYIESKNRHLIFDTDKEETFMSVDPDLMERIMLNLISNSIKFTNPGDSIYITLTTSDSHVKISVRDTGIGIPKNMQPLIFRRFKQVDKTLNRNHEGSGIGLSLVKSIVNLHDGSIIVHSQLKEGSEFIITLPISLCDTPCTSNSYEEISTQTKRVEKTNIEFSDIYS